MKAVVAGWGGGEVWRKVAQGGLGRLSNLPRLAGGDWAHIGGGRGDSTFLPLTNLSDDLWCLTQEIFQNY